MQEELKSEFMESGEDICNVCLKHLPDFLPSYQK